MTQRALTVLMVVSGAVLVYFVVRTVRMRRRNRKTRRYGVLDTNIENMELTPLEQDDEEDDNTLFDANHPRSLCYSICNQRFWQNCGANGQRSDTVAIMSVLISVLTELRAFLKGLDKQSYMDIA
ncbi:hypothetical protein E5288_WYG015311 [Bos mutus]|uniref:Transmembrane protein 157 n=1 Tax=Bos mutus TaxID=72004 RepID=A0A6B0RET8_9CETA|nr:hypothetical protein [Bos mutus]